MRREKIYVTQEDIDKGRDFMANPGRCPIALAATRHFGVQTTCGYCTVTPLKGPYFITSRAARRFMDKLFADHNAKVEPFAFIATEGRERRWR